MVHDSRSCSINQDRSWLYEVQLSYANQIPCDLIEWEMDRDDVRLSEQIIERCIDDTVDGGFVPLDDVISKDIHAKAESASGNCGTNLPHANDASRLSIETRPRTLCPASGTGVYNHLGYMAFQVENESECEVSDLFPVRCRRVGSLDAKVSLASATSTPSKPTP